MQKGTLAIILLECLLCTAQNGPPPMGPMMGQMEMPANIDQFVGAPPTPPSDENEKHYHEFYLDGAAEQNLGAPPPPPPNMGNEQKPEGNQYEQMVGGPLEDLFRVRFIHFTLL